MTNAQKNLLNIDRMLQEHCDGYILVAFNPKDQETLMAVSAKDAKTETALNALMGGILSSGGVGALQDQIRRAQAEAQKGEEEE